MENADEQTATIRRELDARQGKINEMERVSTSCLELLPFQMHLDTLLQKFKKIKLYYILKQNRKLMPKFVLKEMECLYIDEMNSAISTLKSNLESLPVQLGNKPERPKMVLPFNKLGPK